MLIDLHCHEKTYSPCSNAALEDMVAEAKRKKLDAFCITDQYRGKASVTVMIRPENLIVTEQEGLSCTVVFREILGLICRYHIETENGQSLIVDIMNKNCDLLYSVGDTVFISFVVTPYCFLKSRGKYSLPGEY